MSKFVEIQVPASTSNLGPGFDTVGLAVELYNTFTFELSGELLVSIEGHGAKELEVGADNRTYRSFSAVFRSRMQDVPPVHIHHNNGIPLARGLGGSATAVLAGVMAAYTFLGEKPTIDDILAQSTKIENHPDNLTPSLVGGLTVSVMVPGRITYLKVPIPPGVRSVVYIPDMPMLTGQAREVLPKRVPIEDVVFNLQALAMFVAAMATGALEKLRLGMADRLHQPYRAALLPGMNELFGAALDAGAYGVALSGAGSGIFALVGDNADAVAEALSEAGSAHGLGGYSLVLPIEHEGAKILRAEGLS
jgi:homoserine kinase